MRLVVLESPFFASTERERQENVAYARACLLDSLRRGESPIASHLLWPSVLDDGTPSERAEGIEAGLAWLKVAEASVVYTDRGISKGMLLGVDRARKLNVPVEYRSISKDDGR